MQQPVALRPMLYSSMLPRPELQTSRKSQQQRGPADSAETSSSAVKSCVASTAAEQVQRCHIHKHMAARQSRLCRRASQLQTAEIVLTLLPLAPCVQVHSSHQPAGQERTSSDRRSCWAWWGSPRSPGGPCRPGWPALHMLKRQAWQSVLAALLQYAGLVHAVAARCTLRKRCQAGRSEALQQAQLCRLDAQEAVHVSDAGICSADTAGTWSSPDAPVALL